MLRKLTGFLIIVALFAFIGCSSSTSNDQQSQLDQQIENVSKTVYSTTEMIASTSGGNELFTFNVDLGNIPTMGGFGKPTLEKKLVDDILDKAKVAKKASIKEIQGFAKVLEDTVLYEFQFSDSAGNSGYIKVTYDGSIDIAKIYLVITGTPPERLVKTDSTVFYFSLNHTLNDDTDDKLLEAHNVTEFKNIAILLKRSVDVVINAYDANNEPTDISFTEVDIFSDQSFLMTRTANASMVISPPDTTMSLGERLDFRTGEYVERTVSFSSNGTGTYSETRSNGISATGSFDILEDDGHGELHYTLTFPNDHYLQSLQRDAIIDVDFNTGYVSETFKHKYVFRDGSVDSAMVTLSSPDNFETGTVEFQNSKGESGSLTFESSEDYTSISGWMIDKEQRYYVLDIKQFEDGTQEINIQVYASQDAYTNGDDPIMTIHIIIAPDGSGEGELTNADGTYQLLLGNDGVMTLVKDGVSYTVRGWE
jgi:hypothetical protein